MTSSSTLPVCEPNAVPSCEPNVVPGLAGRPDFEPCAPPVLTERALRAELERRHTRNQVILAIVASLLAQAALVLGGFAVAAWFPWATTLCLGYVLFTAVGGSVVAAVFASGRKVHA